MTVYNDTVCHGAIVDNRIHSNYRVLQDADVVDVETVRNAFHDYFHGTTRLNHWVRVKPK